MVPAGFEHGLCGCLKLGARNVRLRLGIVGRTRQYPSSRDGHVVPRVRSSPLRRNTTGTASQVRSQGPWVRWSRSRSCAGIGSRSTGSGPSVDATLIGFHGQCCAPARNRAQG